MNVLEQTLVTNDPRVLQRDAVRVALDGLATLEERAKAYWHACKAARQQANYYGAIKLALAGLALAQREPLTQIEAQLRFELGCLFIWAGDMVQAEDHLAAYLSSGAMDARHVAMAVYNLGLVALHRGEHAGARAQFEHAANAFIALGELARAAQAHANAAWTCMQLQLLDDAGRNLAAAADLLRLHPDDEAETHLLCYRAQYHRLRGDLQAATTCCEAVLAPGRAGANPHHLAEAAWNAGEIALASGRVEEASIFAEVAMRYAMARLYPALFNLVGDLRRRIAARAA